MANLPDYVVDPDAVLKDNAKWRFNRVPDYTKTRKAFQATKTTDHPTGSLESIVQNLVKNWEIEASYKLSLPDWRTIDHEHYKFAVNGAPAQSGEHMLKVGTYNAVVPPNEYYSPEHSDFSSSHVTFKRMMPTFAWEVLEVYKGPPKVVFKWRHWGEMKNDYFGYNNKGQHVMCKAHGKVLSIEGLTIADVNDKLQLQNVEIWYDPLELFRQMGPVLPAKEDDEEETTASVPTNTDEQDYMEHAHGHGKTASAAGVGACPFMKGKL